MNEFLEQALNKLTENVSGWREGAMAQSVREALRNMISEKIGEGTA